jgi:hypothetical protein
MWSRTFGVVALGLVVFGWSALAESSRDVGVVTSVTGPSLSMRVRGNEVRTVRTDAQTTYAKWITHKPWQQSDQASSASLVVGRCVTVDVRADDAATAKVVRVSDEPATSLWDPCKTLR